MNWRRGILCIVATASIASCGGGNGESYELDSSQCTVTSTLQVGSSSAGITACRVRWDASSGVVTWQLMAGGTGSWISPAAGWINISLAGSAPENQVFQVSHVISTLPASVPDDEVVIAMGTGSGRVGATGTASVGDNVINIHGLGGNLSADLSNVTLSNGERLSGSFSARASTSSGTTGGTDGGGGGGTCFSSSMCSGLVSQCSAGGQGPCYCAAACECAAACNTSCQQANHASATSVGFPCAY